MENQKRILKSKSNDFLRTRKTFAVGSPFCLGFFSVSKISEESVVLFFHAFSTLNIHGSKVEPTMDKNEDGHSAYSLEWTSSALDVDKRGKRHKLPVVIQVMRLI